MIRRMTTNIKLNAHLPPTWTLNILDILSPRDKGDLTKKFDQVRVRYRWKGYLSGSMENGCWGVASGGIGHQRSFKVTTQGNLEKKCDLP